MTERLRGLLSILALTILISSIAVPAQNAAIGAIRGTVWDHDLGVPLSGARVSIAGTNVVAVSNQDGAFLLERVPAGAYTVVVSKDGYERQVLSGVAVTGGQVTEIRPEIAAEIVEMDELVVTGTDPLGNEEAGLLEIRAESVNMQDSISAELISKAGVSDAAGALKLVTGASVVGGKYATVRGLSDRYTGTTLNGIRVPSPDPRRRAVQVDLFPTGTIESVTVTKTFTPDLQGDFTGGGVDIRTKGIPEQKLFKVSLSGEYNTGASFNDGFLTYKGGGVGAFGISGDSRDLPDFVSKTRPPQPPRARITSGPGASTPTEAENQAGATVDTYTRSFDPVMGVSTDEGGLGVGASIIAGNRHDIDQDSLFGWMTAWSYSRKQDLYENGVNNTASVGSAEEAFIVSKNRDDRRGSEEVLMGLLASAVIERSDDHRYTFRLVANQGAEDEARLQVQNSAPLEQNQSIQYVERTLVSPQLEGNHTFRGETDEFWGMKFSDIKFDWKAAINFTRQFEPDVRFFRNEFDPVTGIGTKIGGTTESENFLRVFRDIHERNAQFAGDVTLPFTQWTDTEGKIRAGIYVESGTRDYDQLSITYRFNNIQLRPRTASDVPAWQYNSGLPIFSVNRDCASGNCGEYPLWSDVFLEANRIGLATNLDTISNQVLWYAEPVGDDVIYTADQDLRAVYAMAELPLNAKWLLNAGARWEGTKIAIDPSAPFDPENKLDVIVKEGDNRALAHIPAPLAAARINEASLLPAVGISWEMRPAMNLRASWSKTIARPTFREMAPVATSEYLAGDRFIGNNLLQISDITNWDLRWEWFRKSGEVLAASVFYKTLENPIEYISFAVASSAYIQPVNYEHGTVEGFELEARADLDVIWDKLKGLSVGANYTKIDSLVDVPADEQRSLQPSGLAVPERRLLGQPSSIFNINATYDNERTGTSAGIFYNKVGSILLTGAARGDSDNTSDVFEEVVTNLDLTVSQKLRRGISLGFRLRNALEGDQGTFYLRPSGDRFTKFQRPTNRTFTIGVSWNQ